MRLTIAYWYSKIKKRNLVLINNDTHQRETVSERPIRPPLNIVLALYHVYYFSWVSEQAVNCNYRYWHEIFAERLTKNSTSGAFQKTTINRGVATGGGGGAGGRPPPKGFKKKRKILKYGVFSCIKISYSVILNKEIHALRGLLSRF